MSKLEPLLNNTLKDLRNILYRQGIKCNYDDSRAIFYSHKRNKQHYEIADECNGVIIDRATQKIICFPTPLLSDSFSPKVVMHHFKDYDIYAAMDGTVANLYFWNSKWIIATSKGFDMNDVKWNGITWMQAMVDAGLDTSKLTQGTTYTFGFSHPEIHCVDAVRLWFISLYNGARLWAPPESLAIHAQPKLEFKTIGDMTTYLRKPDSYGVILRSRNPETKENSQILLESARMKNLRHLIYDNKLIKEAAEFKFDKNLFAATIAGLNKDTCANFGIVAPKFAKHALLVWQTLNEEADKIMNSEATIWSAELAKIVGTKSKELIVQILGQRKYAAMWYNFCVK